MRKVVLIVEDDVLIRMEAVDLFEDAGYEVIEAGDADAAVEALEARDDITFLFTDIEMPGSMDGMALALAARKRWPPIRILIASGRVKPYVDEMPSGSAFVSNPYDSRQISAAILTTS